MQAHHRVVVPERLRQAQAHYHGEAGRAWVAGLPALAESYLERWQLRPAGAPRCGACALVLPVTCPTHGPSVLKLQAVDDETRGEPLALQTWRGDGAVRLLRHDHTSGAMLLERLDADQTLAARPLAEALPILAALLARLVAVPAPADLRRLDELADALLARAPAAGRRLTDPDDRRLWPAATATLAQLLPVQRQQLLHWDLHYGNVLAGYREPWLVIDPKPLAGEPGFELLPALRNRWSDLVAPGDPATEVRRRFDLLVEVAALDRHRAAGWTLARILEDTCWELESGATTIRPEYRVIADALRADWR